MHVEAFGMTIDGFKQQRRTFTNMSELLLIVDTGEDKELEATAA